MLCRRPGPSVGVVTWLSIKVTGPWGGIHGAFRQGGTIEGYTVEIDFTGFESSIRHNRAAEFRGCRRYTDELRGILTVRQHRTVAEIFYVLVIPIGSGLVLICALGILLALPDRKI